MEIDHRILEKYWSGQCTPEERKAVEAWMAGGVPDKEYALWPTQDEDATKAALWQRVQEKSGIPSQKLTSKTNKAYHMRKWIIPAGIAATFLIVFAIYLFKRPITNVPDKKSLTEYREVTVPSGRKMRVTLSDSTIVYLQAGSTLWYPSDFSTQERHVILEGKAFFSVAKNAGKPFIVETQRTQAKVLGTQFNMRHYEDDEYPSLVVEEGKVQFTATGCADTLILTANNRGVLQHNRLEKTEVNSRNYIAWTKGELIFNGLSLAEAIPELERWYGVNIKLANPELADYRVKASFSNASLNSVLHDLTFTLNIHYTIKNKEVTIYQ